MTGMDSIDIMIQYIYNKIGASTMQKQNDMSELPFEQLFEMGEEKYNQMDYEEAEYYYSLAYHKKPHDDMIVLCYANILKHNDKPNEAQQLLNNSLKANPNGTYKRYFELAEIESGQKSIITFEKGIAVANKCLLNPFLNTAPQPEIKRDIAQAYASIAEICMTDLSNVPFEQVEAKCAEVLEKGKAIDPSCMDVHLQIANCCIEKDQNQMAHNELMIIKTAVLEERQQYEDDLVTQCAKLFMQIGEFQHSIDLLEKLNESQSNNPETVYLLAYAAFQMGQFTLCKDYIECYPEGQMIDEEVEEAMKELKVELSKKIKKGDQQKTEQGCGDDGEEEWMDVEDEDIQQN